MSITSAVMDSNPEDDQIENDRPVGLSASRLACFLLLDRRWLMFLLLECVTSELLRWCGLAACHQLKLLPSFLIKAPRSLSYFPVLLSRTWHVRGAWAVRSAFPSLSHVLKSRRQLLDGKAHFYAVEDGTTEVCVWLSVLLLLLALLVNEAFAGNDFLNMALYSWYSHSLAS